MLSFYCFYLFVYCLLYQAVKACHTLKVFHLHRSGVDDEKVRVLISHVLDHPSLLTLGEYRLHNCRLE